MKIITTLIVTVKEPELIAKIKRFSTIAVFFPLSLVSLNAIADECETYSCKENAKLESRLEKADKALNNEYKNVFRNLTAKQKSKLIAEQREWIKFRDDECEKLADEACEGCDFSNAAQIQKQANDALMCKAAVTDNRIQEFVKMRKEILSGAVPDFSFNREALRVR